MRTNDESDRGEWRFAIVALAPKSPENGARYRCVAVEDGNENETEIPEKVMRLDDEESRAQMIQQCTHSAQDRVGIGKVQRRKERRGNQGDAFLKERQALNNAWTLDFRVIRASVASHLSCPRRHECTTRKQRGEATGDGFVGGNQGRIS